MSVCKVGISESPYNYEFNLLVVFKLHAELVAAGLTAFSTPASMLQLLFALFRARSMRDSRFGDLELFELGEHFAIAVAAAEGKLAGKDRLMHEERRAAEVAGKNNGSTCSCWWCDTEQRAGVLDSILDAAASDDANEDDD
mgnify:CR=1 FL=1